MDNVIPRGSKCDICFSRLINKSDGIYCSNGHKFMISTTREDYIKVCPKCGEDKIKGAKNICNSGHTWLIKSPTDYSLHHLN